MKFKRKEGRENMKKLLAILLVTVMMMCGCGASGDSGASGGTDSAEPKDEEAVSISEEELTEVWDSVKPYFEGIDALDEDVTIRYGDGIGYQLSVPIYIAWKSGALKDLGVNLEWYPSASGPLRVEAIAADEIDLFGTGFGGIAIGCAQGSVKMLNYINDDSVVQKFYVKKDDPLASADYNEAGFRGTKEDWKGREVYMQSGSTLQYLLGDSLSKIGLSLQDVTPVYMDQPNVNAAMFAGKGETWGVWNFQCYDASLEEEGFVPVIEGYDVGINLVTGYGTSEKAWSDENIRAGIEKILEAHYAILDWMMDSDENMGFAAKALTYWGEQEGTAVPYEENLAYLKETHYYTLEENYEYFTETVENDYGKMFKALDMAMGAMDFYISQGNYQESDRKYMIENQENLFTAEGLEYVQSVR